MKRKIEIEYEWWSGGEKQQPEHNHQNDLAVEAEERIFSQMQDGFMSGELNADIEDEGKEYSYRGWWEVSEVIVDEDKLTPEEFNATHLAYAAAYGEYIDEPEMSITEMIYSLEASGTDLPSLQVIEAYDGMPANKLLKEISLTTRGLSSLMEVAYNAGKAGKNLI